MSENVQTIVLNQVEKYFGKIKKPAVEALTLTIKGGAVTGLVGPDGAGKTTLLRMLAGLLTPTSGSISVAQLDPVTEQAKLRSKIGYMPQKFGLYEDLSVIENLTLFADLKGIVGQARVEMFQRLLKFTDLTNFTKRLAGRLSGGMKQKLGLACTLLGDPSVLLLDEPGVGVDPISRVELWRMVHELASEGMLILWSTSYLDEAEQCPSIVLLNEGKLLFDGAPQKLTTRIEGRSFLISTDRYLHRELMQRALLLPEVSDAIIQGHFVRLILSEDASSDAVLQQLRLERSELIETPARFEDAFIDLLGGITERESVLAKVMPQIKSEHEVVIEAKQLTKKFGDFAATNNITFNVKAGEIFGLLGPNGAGKSTTFKMMCGLLTPTSGDALVLGLNFKTSSSKARQHLGYMAQKFSLYGNISVKQNLQFFSGIYGLKGKLQRERINEMTEVFNLHPILNDTPDNLPLGFKQRLALACSLMHRPDIIFLDEPTSGVDPITRREFWLHINGMVNKGVTVLVTTHFMEEAEYCDRIGLIYRGKMIELDQPEHLKQRIASSENPNPTMQDVFIKCIQDYKEE